MSGFFEKEQNRREGMTTAAVTGNADGPLPQPFGEDHDDPLTSYTLFTRTTAKYPAEGDMRETMYLALGLGGETGECLEHVKKWYRDGSFDKKAFIKELGDVFWYLCRLCDTVGVSPLEVLYQNFVKLTSRKARGVLHGGGNDR